MAFSLEMTLDQFAGVIAREAEGWVRIDFTRAMRSCVLAAKSEIALNFQRQRSPDGTPWAPMKSPRDRARDRKAARRGGTQQLLLDRGLLRASYLAGPGGSKHIEAVTPFSFTVGSNLEYAAAHQNGAVINKPERRRVAGQKPWVFRGPGGEAIFTRKIRSHIVRIPARPVAGWSPTLIETCEDIVLDHVERQAA